MSKENMAAGHGGKAHSFGVTDIACIIVFLLLVFGFAAAMPLLPDREFSESEGHALAQFPALSSGADKSIPEQLREGKFLDRFFDGSFMRDFTGYAADQFPLRDQFVEAKAYAYSRLFLGENNGYFLTRDGYIVKIDEEPDMVAAADNIGAVYDLAGELSQRGIPLTLAVAGRSLDMLASDLPAFYPAQALSDDVWERFDELLIETRNAHSETAVTYADLLSVLRDRAEAAPEEQLYYRTDHHWTTLGAYYAYRAVIEAMGDVPYELSDFTPELASGDFHGTSQRSSGMRWVGSDEIWFYRFDGDEGFVTASGGESFDGFYDRSYLGVTDKYSAFIGGNSGLVTVTAKGVPSDGERQTLLLVKDSFAHSMVPFLARHYDLVIVDTRYYVDYSTDLVEKYGVDKVLVLGYITSFTERSGKLTLMPFLCGTGGM